MEEEEGVVMMMMMMMMMINDDDDDDEWTRLTFWGCSIDVTRIIFVEYDNGQTFCDLKYN
jgi:hypothetical protein